MANVFAKRINAELVFFAQTHINPTDSEWESVLKMTDGAPPELPFRCLVITDGGAPTLKQRKTLDAKMQVAARKGGKTAVVTESAATRALLAALAWVSRNQLKAFPAADLDKAYAHLNVGPAERAELEKAIAEGAHALGLAIFKATPLGRIA